MIGAALAVACGAWRFVDGLSKETSGIATGIRNVVTVALAFAAAWQPWAHGWGAPDWPVFWYAAGASASIIIGCTRWEDWTWQAIRFGGMAAATALPAGLVGGWIYVAACIAAGLAYPALARVDGWLPRWWRFDGFEAYARFAIGAAVLGGLSMLPPV